MCEFMMCEFMMCEFMMIELKSAKTRINDAAVELFCVCECLWGEKKF